MFMRLFCISSYIRSPPLSFTLILSLPLSLCFLSNKKTGIWSPHSSLPVITFIPSTPYTFFLYLVYQATIFHYFKHNIRHTQLKPLHQFRGPDEYNLSLLKPLHMAGQFQSCILILFSCRIFHGSLDGKHLSVGSVLNHICQHLYYGSFGFPIYCYYTC